MGVSCIVQTLYSNIRCLSTKSKPSAMKYLNVAEKNDAAKNIASILSRGNSTRREGLSHYNKIYEFDATVFGNPIRMVMTSVSGHLLNYAFTSNFRGWQSCSPFALFDAPIVKECPQDYQNIKNTLEREIRTCGGLIIWTDCDREGENIGFEIIKVCTDIKPNIPVYRAKFSEITAASIFRALNTLGQADKRVSDAVDVRQELDLRTGAAFTRLQTLRLQKVFPQKLADKLISYGSCQFPTLGFVVERYQAIENFVPEPFWKIKMNHTIKELTVDYNWKRERLFNKNACEAILDVCRENPTATVENVENKPKSKWRPLPLDTVELEKTISRKLRINAKDTMKIAERLYTQGYISYPRTETNIFPKELNLVPLVEQQCPDGRWGAFAQGILNDGGPNPRQGRKSDQAHPPIHPTKYANDLAGNDQRIYEYIVRHFLACLSKDALGHETVVHVDIADEKFIAKGLLILERNYLEIYIYDKWNAKEIHEYHVGDTFIPTVLDLFEGTTTAPKLLTEADLIALMEKHGIGTDATHAEHIETIKSREYVGLNDNIYFVPGTLGMGLVEGYNNVGLEVSLAKPSLRADFENDLKLICEGRKNPETVRREQIEKYKAVFRTVMEKMGEIDQSLAHRLEDQPQRIQENEAVVQDEYKPVLKCPKCGNDMVLRNRKTGNGKFLSCNGYPACKNAIWLSSCIDTVEVLQESCENCGPDVKKLKMKFKQNLFPGEPNPNVLCIGGCDLIVLETLDIRASTVTRVNNGNAGINGPVNRNAGINAPVNNNIPVIPNQQTLNNWIAGVENDPTVANTNRNQNPGNNNTRPGNGTRSYSTQSGVNNGRPGGFEAAPNNDRWLPRTFLNPGQSSTTTSNFLPVPNMNRTGGFNGTAGDDDTNIVCTCGTEAVLLTVRKEGPNTGRKFYKCGGSGGCDFFMWSPDSGPQTRPNGSNTFTRQNTTELKCNCNLAAVQRVVTKVGPNTGRKFYSCSKPIGQGCNFFKWADETNGQDVPHGDNDDDDGDDGGDGGGDDGWGGNLNQSWGPANTSRWTGGSGSNWRKKNTKAKSKSKKRLKTMSPFGNSSRGGKSKGRGPRRCTVCGQEGHNRTKCPNS